ncbi:MAG: hypothetical protein AAFP97_04225 [Pseudomonadota bacterium]
MASTAQERFEEARRVFNDTEKNKRVDLRDSTTLAQVQSVLRNAEKAEIVYLKASRAVLEANGPAVEAAYKAAKSANDAVSKARKDAEAVADRIRKVATAISAVGDLVNKAKS